MDTILSGLTVFGLAALMGAALSWSVYHALTKTVPEMVRLHRADLADQRERYHQLLHTEHETFRETRAAAESRGLDAAAGVVRALESLERQAAEQSRQLQALTALIQQTTHQREGSTNG